MSQLSVAERWARIGPRDVPWMFHVPKAGLCLSSFLIVRKGGAILLGRPHANASWPEKGGYPERHAAVIERDGSWLLPATHLLMEESPDHAARRIANEWAGVGGTPRFVAVQSHIRPQLRSKPRSKRKAGLNHWDICFIYELNTKQKPRARSWWSETRFFPPREVRRMKLSRGHKDVLKVGGYLGRD